jgi:uncharacterized protein
MQKTDSKTSSEMTRAVAQRWFDALKAGNGPAALECLDDDVKWINCPAAPGLSDIIPWLGEYDGRKAVEGTFVIWKELATVKSFELLELVTNNDEALAVVHEIGEIKATGLCYDSEILYRIRIANDKIVFWKATWDTVKGIAAFRGNMKERLIHAAKHADTNTMLKLLPFGADPNTVEKDSNQSLLMLAAGRGDNSTVKLLLQNGADPNMIDRRAGVSALHKACQGGHLDVVTELVNAGAFIDLQATTTGHTPLIEAIWFKSTPIVDYLLNMKARIELKTYYGFTIDDHINYALRVNPQESAQLNLKKIKDLVAQRRTSDEEQIRNCQLITAILKGDDVNVVRKLLEKSATPDDRYPIVGSFSDGHTALLVAARDGHTEIVRELLAKGADVNAIEPVFGACPLHKATYNGHLDITRILSSAPNVNLNYQGPSNGYTPLLDALWHGFAEVAEVLLDAGALVNILGYDGKSALDMAVEQLGTNHQVVQKTRDLLKKQQTL